MHVRWFDDVCGPIVDEVRQVLDAPEDEERSSLVWIDAAPGRGASTLLREVVRRTVEQRDGWRLREPQAGDGWARVRQAARQEVPQPMPGPGKPAWLCLGIDGIRSSTDPYKELVAALGVLFLSGQQAEMPPEGVSIGDWARGVGARGGIELTKFGVGLLPGIGPIINLLWSATDVVGLAELNQWAQNRRSAVGAGAESEEELVGAQIANQLLEAVGALDLTAAIPILLAIDDAEQVGPEIRSLVRTLLLDESEASRAVVVVAASSTDGGVPWLEELHHDLTGSADVAGEVPDAGAEPDGADADDATDDHGSLTSSWLTLNKSVAGATRSLCPIDAASASSLVRSVVSEDELPDEVLEVLVSRSLDPDGYTVASTLFGYLEAGAKRSSDQHQQLDVAWASTLESTVAAFASAQVADLVTAAAHEVAFLGAVCRLGGKVPRALAVELADALGLDTPIEKLAAIGLRLVSVGTVSVAVRNLGEVGGAIERELATSADGSETVARAVSRATANWLATVAAAMVDGDLRWSRARLPESAAACRIGLESPPTNGVEIGPTVRLALQLGFAPVDEAWMLLQRARLDLADPRVRRDAVWLLLAHAATTSHHIDPSIQAQHARAAMVGEALGFVADRRACDDELRAHWTVGSLISYAFTHLPSHRELAERALVAFAPLAPNVASNMVHRLDAEQLDALVAALAETAPSIDRDRLLVRLAQLVADRAPIVQALLPTVGTHVSSAVALASVAEGIADADLKLTAGAAAPEEARTDQVVIAPPIDGEDTVDEGGGGEPEEAREGDTEDGGSEENVDVCPPLEDARRRALALLLPLVHDEPGSATRVANDVERTLARVSYARLAAETTDEDLRSDAYDLLRDRIDNPGEAVVLCRLAEGGSLERRRDAMEATRDVMMTAPVTAAKARLVQRDEQPHQLAPEPPPEGAQPDASATRLSLTTMLGKHRGHPHCLAHLMRLTPSEAFSPAHAVRVRSSHSDLGRTTIDELWQFRDLDPRALVPLAAHDVFDGPRRRQLMEALEKALRSDRKHQPSYCLALLRLRGAGDRQPSAALRRALEEGLQPGQWPDAQRQRLARRIVDAPVDSLPPHLRKAARTIVWEHRSDWRNAAVLARAHRRDGRPIPEGVIGRLRRAADDHPGAAIAALESGSGSGAAWKFCWHALRRHAVTEPSVLPDMARLARNQEERSDVVMAVRMHRRTDLWAAIASLPAEGTITLSDTRSLLVWTGADPSAACRLAATYPLRRGSPDRLSGDVRARLRAQLMHHARRDLACADALLSFDALAREPRAQLHRQVLLAPASFESAALLVRCAQEPADAERALHLLVKSAAGRYRDPQVLDAIERHATDAPSFDVLRTVITIRTNGPRPGQEPGQGDAARKAAARSVDRTLEHAEQGFSAQDRTRRLSSWAAASFVLEHRNWLGRAAGLPPEKLGDRAFSLMVTMAKQPTQGLSVLPLLADRARPSKARRERREQPQGRGRGGRSPQPKSDRDRVRRVYLAHLDKHNDPSLAVTSWLINDAIGAYERSSNTNIGRSAAVAAVLNKHQARDVSFLALRQILKERGGLDARVNCSKIREGCQQGTFEIEAVCALARLEDYGVALPGRPVPLDRLITRVLQDWDRRLSDWERRILITRSQGLKHPFARLLLAWGAAQNPDPGWRWTAMATIEGDIDEHAYLAIAYARLASTSTQLERARVALRQHAGTDIRAARELRGLGLTLQRRADLFQTVANGTYPNVLDAPSLLAELAADDRERQEATRRLLALEDRVDAWIALAALGTRDAEVLEQLRQWEPAETEGKHRRHLAAHALIGPYLRSGGYKELGWDLFTRIGDEIEWGPTALEVLRATAGDAQVPLTDDQRGIAVDAALKALRRGGLRSSDLLAVLRPEEEIRGLVAQIRNETTPVDELVRSIYSIPRDDYIDECHVALLRHMATSPDAALTLLWKLGGRDLDDPLYLEAWLALEAHASVTPHSLQGLVRLSKRPLAQRALVEDLISLRASTRNSPQADATTRETLALLEGGLGDGSPARRRRTVAARVVLRPTRAALSEGLRHLIADDATTYELGAALLAAPSREDTKGIERRLVARMADHPSELPTVLLLGCIGSNPARVAGNVALRANLVRFDSQVLPTVERTALHERLVIVNRRWASDAGNAHTLLRLFATDSNLLKDQHVQFVRDLMRRDDLRGWFLEQFCYSIPASMCDEVRPALATMAPTATPAELDAANVVLVKRMPRHRRSTRRTSADQGPAAVDPPGGADPVDPVDARGPAVTPPADPVDAQGPAVTPPADPVDARGPAATPPAAGPSSKPVDPASPDAVTAGPRIPVLPLVVAALVLVTILLFLGLRLA